VGRHRPPTPGPGVKRMKPNGLVAAASIGLPHVDAQVAANLASSLHQGDVQVAEGDLDQLGDLALLRRGHGHRGVDQLVEGALDCGQGRPRPETTLGVRSNVHSLLPGSTCSGL